MDSKDQPEPQGRAVEGWLHKRVGPAYDALKADPSRALTADQVRARLAAAAQEQQPEKGAGLSVGGAFLAGVAVGLVVSDQAPHGEPAHVHLSLGDDDSSGDTKDGKECDHDQGRDFDR